MKDLEYRVPSPHYLRLSMGDRTLCLKTYNDPILTSTRLQPSESGIYISILFSDYMKYKTVNNSLELLLCYKLYTMSDSEHLEIDFKL